LLTVKKDQPANTTLNISNSSPSGTAILQLDNDTASFAGYVFVGGSGYCCFAGGNSLNIGNAASGPIAFYTRPSGADLERMRITSAGNVGIGTTAPQHLLHVAGTIGAKEIIVSSTGADYVFQPNYRLRPLSEVRAYIQANHHLPDIPSASEVAQKGLSVGDMQTKLLAKIEELTLHMIQEHERNDRLEQELETLRKQNQEPSKRNN
jgi:hypothetical protein